MKFYSLLILIVSLLFAGCIPSEPVPAPTVLPIQASTETPVPPTEAPTIVPTATEIPVGQIDPNHPEAELRPEGSTGFDAAVDRWTKADSSGNTLYALQEIGIDQWGYLATDKDASLFGSALFYGTYPDNTPIRIFTPWPDLKIEVGGSDYAAQFPNDKINRSFPTELSVGLAVRIGLPAKLNKTYQQLTADDMKNMLADIPKGNVSIEVGILSNVHDKNTRESHTCNLKNGFTYIFVNRKVTGTDPSFYHMFDRWEWKVQENNQWCTFIMGMDDPNKLDKSIFAERMTEVIWDLMFNKDLPVNDTIFGINVQGYSVMAGTNAKWADGFRTTIPFIRITKP